MITWLTPGKSKVLFACFKLSGSPKALLMHAVQDRRFPPESPDLSDRHQWRGFPPEHPPEMHLALLERLEKSWDRFPLLHTSDTNHLAGMPETGWSPSLNHRTIMQFGESLQDHQVCTHSFSTHESFCCLFRISNPYGTSAQCATQKCALRAWDARYMLETSQEPH